LTEQSIISILSFGPGTEVYGIWGHTAIRVNDPELGIDKVYNYGTFDFDTPNFTLRFIRGKLDYALSIQQYHRVIKAYKKEKRWIKEQILNLSFDERLDLYKLLEENYLKENRYYKYDFLFDNCATRPLEIIEKSIVDSVNFSNPIDQSYRDILDEHLIHNPWTDFGIDLIIGAIADRTADARQQMFMPVYIYRYFNSGERSGNDNQGLIANEILIAEEGAIQRANTHKIIQPFSIFLILLILELILLFLSIKKKKIIAPWYDQIWFLIAFLGSALMLFMWFGTDHVPTKYNWNLWWMNPAFFLLLPFFNRSFRKKIAKFQFVILIALILGWFIIPQQFHLAVLPIVGILGVKSYKYGFLMFDA